MAWQARDAFQRELYQKQRDAGSCRGTLLKGRPGGWPAICCTRGCTGRMLYRWSRQPWYAPALTWIPRS